MPIQPKCVKKSRQCRVLMLLQWAVALLVIQAALSCSNANSDPASAPQRRVGVPSPGVTLLPTGQAVRPAGDTLSYLGRPLDLIVSADGRSIYVKDTVGLIILDAQTWKIRQRLPFAKDDSGS